jgi:hypothetical protein
MSGSSEVRASYRLDPHEEGVWLGLGLVRLAVLCGALLLGAVLLYTGGLLAAVACFVVVPPIVLARWDGLLLAAWIPLGLMHHFPGAREWAPDPEHVGWTTPLDTPATDPQPTIDRNEPR